MFERMLSFEGVGKRGLDRLKRSIVTIVGIGALGTVVAEQLARSGIGSLVLIDRDVVEEANLSSQHLYSKQDVGMPKAAAAKSHITGFSCKVVAHASELTGSNASSLLKEGLVIDCTDNFPTRHIINEHCRKRGKKWIHGAAQAAIGNTMVFREKGACFNCVFGDSKPSTSCETDGILVMAADMVGSMQSMLALKLLLGKRVPEGMIRIDAWNHSMELIKVRGRGCEVCRGGFPHLGQEMPRLQPLCGGLFQARARVRKASFKDVKKLAPGVFSSGPFTVFNDGRVLIRARSMAEAELLLAKTINS